MSKPLSIPMPAAPTVRRLTTVAALVAAGTLLTATPALAHVTVDPGEAEQGGYGVVNFKVPNERDNASTVKLEVTLPADHPMASVMPQPVPGWDVEVTQRKLDTPIEVHGEKVTEAPSKITWSGGTIEPGTFQQFPVSMGKLPEDTEQLVFKTLQTYDNKEVVRWIEAPSADGSEVQDPAPVLHLLPAGGSSETETAAKNGAGSDAGSDAGSAETASADSSDTTARVLGGVGIAVGVVGVAFGVLASRRART